MADYHLSMTGSAPSGESFDVTLYFDRDVTWSLQHRIDALGKAAYEASKAVLLSDPCDSAREGAEGVTDGPARWGEVTRRDHSEHVKLGGAL